MLKNSVATTGLSGAAPDQVAPRTAHWARRIVHAALARMRVGRLTIVDGDERTFGGTADGLATRIEVRHPRLYRDVLTNGVLGSAEAYIADAWRCTDLTSALRVFLQNESAMTELDARLGWLTRGLRRFGYWLHRNTRSGSKRNILAHYDLGNDFYRLWLDDSMTYSSGIYGTPNATLAEAQIEKYDQLCRKLDLQPSDHLLEIGTGWGGMALHAARHYGCRVTTTTISDKQHEWAVARVREAGLEDRITLLITDYRDLTGKFDKLVSIEMIEAVGWQYYDTYFAKCATLLKPSGRMAIQAITIADRYYEAAKREVDFIKKYVFPGSCIPSANAMYASAARCTDLTPIHSEDFAEDYAETLREWRTRFFAKLDEVRALGFGEDFIRMWEFYLCYCEAGFRERTIGVGQFVFSKPLDRPASRLRDISSHGRPESHTSLRS